MHVRVLQGLLRRQPLLGVEHQEPLQKVQGLGRGGGRQELLQSQLGPAAGTESTLRFRSTESSQPAPRPEVEEPQSVQQKKTLTGTSHG